MSCKQCNDPCETPCKCAEPCAPTPCTTGCLVDVWSNCGFLSEDLTICTDIIPKSTTFTDVFKAIADKLCGNIVVTASDIKVKASATDNASGYLFEKIIGSSGISIINSNIGGFEKLIASVQLSAASNNCLQVLADGLYMACPSTGSTPTTLVAIDTNTVDTTVTPTVGGYSVKSDIKIDTTPNNALVVGPNGLYVPPAPSGGNTTTVSVIDTASVDLSILHVGNDYQIAADVRIDPTGTLPITQGPNGIKFDSPILGNTLFTVANSTSVQHTLTPIIGGYNLQSTVKLDPSGTNGLVITPNGLYVAASSGGTVSTTDTDTVNMTTLPGNNIKADVKYQDSTSVKITSDASGIKATANIDTTTGGNVLVDTGNGLYVPATPVTYSADTCNAAHAGTDGNLFVQAPLLPDALRLYNDGINFIFEFSGTSTVNTDYEVEFRGTTGSPLLWTNGDSNYISVTSGVLKYTVINAAGALTGCEILGARVRTKCTNGVGEWASILIDPAKDIHFGSSDNSIAININPAGDDCGLTDLTLQRNNACDPITVGDISYVLQNDGDDTNLLVAWIGPNDYDTVSVKVDYTNVSGNPAHVRALLGTYNPTGAKTVISLPFFGVKIPHTLTLQATKHCSVLTVGNSTTLTSSLVYTPTACSSYQAVPAGLLVNGWNPDNLSYIVENNKLKFRGGVYKDFSVGPPIAVLGTVIPTGSSAWARIDDDIFNTTGLTLCGYPLPSGNANYGIKDHLYNRHGVYSYSSVVINDANNTDINFSLLKTGTTFQLRRDYMSYRDDNNQTHTGVLFSGTNTYRDIYISFEGVTIDLI